MAYEINININGEYSDDGVSGGASKTTNGVSKPSELEKAKKNVLGYVSSQTIKPFLANVKTQISQNIGIVTGNSELQQRVNFAFEVVQYGNEAYKNAQAGAITFAALGLSKGAGALIGLGLTALNTAMEIGFNQHQINLEKRMENYQLQQLRDRQGVAFNRSRL